MDALPFHPKLVHLPMALAVLMPLLSLGLLVAWWRQWLPRRSWIVVIALQAVLLATGIAALRTGESDEERVEERVPESAIEAHEEAAQVFVVGSAVVLLLAVAAVFPRREGLARSAAAAAAAGTLVVLFLGYRTGDAGGRLVYQHGAAGAFTTPSAAAGEPSEAAVAAGEHEDDDD